MLKLLGVAVVVIASLYMAGFRPETVRHQLDLQRQQHATVSELHDQSDWG
jgi:hypothetical protein